MVTRDIVKKIAKLAHLQVSDREAEQLAPKLASIIGYIDQLKTYEVADIEPMSHVHGVTNVFREDELSDSSPFEMLAQNVPDRSGRYIRVPLVVD